MLHAGDSGEGCGFKSGVLALAALSCDSRPHTQAIKPCAVNWRGEAARSPSRLHSARRMQVHQSQTTTVTRKEFLHRCCMLLIAAQSVLEPGDGTEPKGRGAVESQ